MRCRNNRGGDPRAGFTLTEVLVAAFVAALAMAGALAAFSMASRSAQAGSSQVQFNAWAREAEQKVVRYVESGKTVGVSSNGIDIMSVNLTCSRIAFVDGDGNPATVADNQLVYIPNIVAPSVVPICGYVSPIGTNSMFSMVPSSPSSARFMFHIGDGTNAVDASFSGTGQGYQGVEVRISATPRNLQRWYD